MPTMLKSRNYFDDILVNWLPFSLKELKHVNRGQFEEINYCRSHVSDGEVEKERQGRVAGDLQTKLQPQVLQNSR